jgi:hypothetical protein
MGPQMLNTRHLVTLGVVAILLQILLTQSAGAIGDEDARRCQSAASVCASGDDPAFCMTYKNNFTREGLICPGVNAPTLPVTSIAIAETSADQKTERCMAMRRHCENGESACSWLRDALKDDGIICPGLGSPSRSATIGAYSTPTAHPARIEPSSQYARSSEAADILANIQAECDAALGHSSFGSHVKCIKNGIQNSRGLATADSGDVQLYVLTADRLMDDVARKQITVAAARVELQKAFLEFRERTYRKTAEASNRQNAARLEAQAQQAEVERRQAAADAEARAAEAVRQYAQAQANAQMMAAVQNCVALAYGRQNALATSPNLSVRSIANGQQGLRNFAGVTMESACQKDPNWYLTIPVAPTITNCQSMGLGNFNCTTH